MYERKQPTGQSVTLSAWIPGDPCNRGRGVGVEPTSGPGGDSGPRRSDMAPKRASAGQPEERADELRAHQSIKLPLSLRRRLRLWAAFLDVEISELAEEGIGARLDELDAERRRRGLPPLPNPDEVERVG